MLVLLLTNYICLIYGCIIVSALRKEKTNTFKSDYARSYARHRLCLHPKLLLLIFLLETIQYDKGWNAYKSG